MLRCLCGSPSISLSFNLAAVLPRRNTYCVSCDTEGVIPPISSIHRLRRGLPGYLILFAPHAFEPQCQLQSSKPPSPLVFFLISTHSTATLGIPLSSTALKSASFGSSTRVKPWVLHFQLSQPPTHPLRPVIPDNACPLRITAAAGT